MVFGYTYVEWLEFFKYLAPALIVGGAVLRFGRSFIDKILNRQYDNVLVSVTTPSAPDSVTGKRKLVLDNFGSAEIFDQKIRGSTVRKEMTAAAKQCSWKPCYRFVNLGLAARQRLMFEAVRNWITGFWQDRVRAHLEGTPMIADENTFFAVTGSDNAVGSTRKFRFLVIRREHCEIFLDPSIEWDFQETWHDVRLQTVRLMAQAIQSGTKSIDIDGVSVQIVEFVRTYRPA